MNENGRFPRTAWFIMAAALLLLLASVAQVVYRATLATDGWSVYTTDVEDSNWYLDKNLVGAASELQRDDAILAVDGRSVIGKATNEYIPAPPRWQVAQTVTMLVQRGDMQLEIDVPVVHWTGTAVWRYNVGELANLTDPIGALLLLAVSWFTFLRRPQVASASALLLLGTALAAATISGVLPDGLSVQFNQIAFYLSAFFSYIIFGTVLAPSLLTFALFFPQPKRALQRRRWLALLPFGYGFVLLIYLLWGGRAEVGWLSTLAMLALAVASFVHAARTQRDAVSRAQLRWAISGFVAGLALFALNFPLGFGLITDQFWVDLISAVASLGFVLIGLGLAVAILRYRLYDIDIIIRKTLVYTVLSGLLALIYFGAVILLQSVFESVSGQQSPLVIVLSTLLIAALFTPLRQRVQAFIDRRFFRQKYDAQQILAQFAQTARDEVSLEALRAALAHVIQETIQPEQISVWLKSTDRRENANE